MVVKLQTTLVMNTPETFLAVKKTLEEILTVSRDFMDQTKPKGIVFGFGKLPKMVEVTAVIPTLSATPGGTSVLSTGKTIGGA